MLKRTLHIITLCLVALLAAGCASVSTIDPPPVPANNPTPFPGFSFATLDLANGVVPLPNDLLRNAETGRVSFPGTGEPFDAINSLDGFSTSGPIIIPFTGLIVEESVNNDSIRLFDTTSGEQRALSFSVSDNGTNSTVIAFPVRALEPSRTHIVVITQGVISALSGTPILSDNPTNFTKETSPLVDGNGNSTSRLLTNEQAQALEPVRQGYQPIWAGAEQLVGTNRANIPLAFAFTTQTLYQDLPLARTAVLQANAGLVNRNPVIPTFPVAQGHGPGGGPLPTVPEFYNQFVPPPFNEAPIESIGSIWLGSVDAPVFRETTEDFWSSPPVQTGTQEVRFFLFLPDDGDPPFPTAIFQHGITRSKSDSFVLANAYNSQGLALIAIDLELHGDLQLPVIDPETGEPEINPDTGQIVRLPSGEGFINLGNLRAARDNIRQSVVNEYALTQAIVSGQSALAGGGNPLLAPIPPFFTGTSLGGMVGTLFLATEENVSRAVLNVPGARIFPLLITSPAFGPPVLEGLAANGVVQGTTQFAQFSLIAQTVIDDADPVNYGRKAIDGSLLARQGSQLLQQIALADQVILPERQYDLSIQLGTGQSDPAFSQVDAKNPIELLAQVLSPFVGPGMFEIPNAGHGALLNPADGPTVQVVTQVLAYLGLGTIIDPGFPALLDSLGRVTDEGELEDYRRAIRF